MSGSYNEPRPGAVKHEFRRRGSRKTARVLKNQLVRWRSGGVAFSIGLTSRLGGDVEPRAEQIHHWVVLVGLDCFLEHDNGLGARAGQP